MSPLLLDSNALATAVDVGGQLTLVGFMFLMLKYFMNKLDEMQKRNDEVQAKRDAIMDAHIIRIEKVMEVHDGRLEKIVHDYHAVCSEVTKATLRLSAGPNQT